MDIAKKDKVMLSMTNVKPNTEQLTKIEAIITSYKAVVDVLDVNCKDDKELDVSLEKLQESLLWAVNTVTLPV